MPQRRLRGHTAFTSATEDQLFAPVCGCSGVMAAPSASLLFWRSTLWLVRTPASRLLICAVFTHLWTQIWCSLHADALQASNQRIYAELKEAPALQVWTSAVVCLAVTPHSVQHTVCKVVCYTVYLVRQPGLRGLWRAGSVTQGEDFDGGRRRGAQATLLGC